MTRTIALMTGGGDCPGLNAAIRTVVRVATQTYGYRVIGIRDGYAGLIERRYHELGVGDTRGILRLGGTILGSSNRTDPTRYVPPEGGAMFDATDLAHETLHDIGADAMIVIGGDGTLFLSHRFAGDRIPLVGIPKTIDNDVHGTDAAIGFDSCITTVTDAIDKLHTTAESHHRVLLIEVMGRTAGWVALYGGVAGGADIALIPERSYTLQDFADVIERRKQAGRNFTVAVVAEGVADPSGAEHYWSGGDDARLRRLGGVCHPLAEAIGKVTAQEVRAIVLGHLQRGGSPTVADRVLATQLAYAAVVAIHQDEGGVMAGLRGNDAVLVPLEQVAVGPRLVPDDHPLLRAAEAMGMFVG